VAGTVTGFEEWDGILRDLERRAENVSPTSSAVHRELLNAYAATNIPTDSGRLRDSLVNASHPDHVFRFFGDRFEIGSLDPAATFNPSAIPQIDATRALNIIAEFVLRGGNRARGSR